MISNDPITRYTPTQDEVEFLQPFFESLVFPDYPIEMEIQNICKRVILTLNLTEQENNCFEENESKFKNFKSKFSTPQGSSPVAVNGSMNGLKVSFNDDGEIIDVILDQYEINKNASAESKIVELYEDSSRYLRISSLPVVSDLVLRNIKIFIDKSNCNRATWNLAYGLHRRDKYIESHPGRSIRDHIVEHNSKKYDN